MVLSADDGKVLATLPIGKGVDGGGFNPNTLEAFSSQGDGTLTILKENSPTEFVVEQNVETKAGAKTCTLDSKTEPNSGDHGRAGAGGNAARGGHHSLTRGNAGGRRRRARPTERRASRRRWGQNGARLVPDPGRRQVSAFRAHPPYLEGANMLRGIAGPSRILAVRGDFRVHFPWSFDMNAMLSLSAAPLVLSAAAGLNAYIPLLLISILARTGHVTPDGTVQ